MGLGIQAAKAAAYSQLSIKEAAKQYGVSTGTLLCAARRLGFKLRKTKQNRNLMYMKNAYYFRVRRKSMSAFWYLGRDIEKAREIRDRLEQFFKTL